MLTTSRSLPYDELHIPLLMIPAGKDYLWGGRRLVEEFDKSWGEGVLAESWECSTHPDGLSFIANGPWQGRSLLEYVNAYPQVMGRHGVKDAETAEGGQCVPVLVKLIDAAKDLSIQVHPNDEYARCHENDMGKTEMWYVLDAEPGASLVYGFSHDITKEQLRKYVAEGSIGRHVQQIPVQKDDVFFVRPGTVHAIGGGVLLAEIQQCSNVTYRVYDYDRVDTKGQKRPLHLEKALDVMDRKSAPAVRQQLRVLRYRPGVAQESLCQCPYFLVHRLLVNGEHCWQVSEQSFEILLMLDGELTIGQGTDGELCLKKGNCVFLPAGMGEISLAGKGQLLRISC